MSDENSAFACPATGEPLDLCSCDLHGGQPGPKDGKSTTPAAASGIGSAVSTGKQPAATAPQASASVGSSAAPPTEAEYLSPKAESARSQASAEPAPATGSTSTASPGALQLAQEPAKPVAAAISQGTQAAVRRHVKSAERNLEVVQRMDRKLRRENGRTMLAITRAPEIDPDAPKPEGWSDKEFRIAKAAWKSTRECPAFITIAEKTYSTVLRAEALRDHDPSPNLNCDIQVFVQQNTYNYEVVEAEENK